MTLDYGDGNVTFIKMTNLQLIIIIAAILHVFSETGLNFLNFKNILEKKRPQPEKTKNLMDADQWCKASEYAISKSKITILEDILGLILFIPIILYLYPFIFEGWDVSSSSGIFRCASISVAFLMIIQMPGLLTDWYKQFNVEEKFGFNKSNPRLWVSDKIKENLLGFLFGTLIFALLIWLYRTLSSFSSYWWLIAFCTFFLVQLSMMILWPKFILPLFNKLSPLEDGDLKKRLFDLAERTGFKAQTIEIIDGSKRSSHSNAFFTGFGKFRRIVLYDTLLKQMDDREVEAVLAHEIGHYKEGHIPKKLILSFITGVVAFYIISLGMKQDWLYAGLELPQHYAGSISAVLIALILIVPNFTYWLTPISNIFSRKHEYEADRFAKNAMKGPSELISAIQKLYRENLSHPLPHQFLVFFHYSHPTFFERKEALEKD